MSFSTTQQASPAPPEENTSLGTNTAPKECTDTSCLDANGTQAPLASNGVGNSDVALSPDIAMLLAQSMHYVSDAVKIIRYHNGQFTFHYLNESARKEYRDLGFQPDLFLHRTPKECFPTAQAQELIKSYSVVVETKREQTFTITFSNPLGNTKVFQRRLIPCLNENGEIPFIITIVKDITAQNSISKHQQRLALMLENIPDILMLADTTSIYFFNPDAQQRLEIPPVNDRTLTPYDFFDNPSILDNVIFPAVRAHDTWKGECTMRTLGGKTFPASVIVVGQRKEDENIEEYVFICIDRTEQKAVQQRLVESERIARLIIENVKQYAFIQLDPFGTVISWNHGAERTFEYDADMIIGRHVGILEPVSDETGRIGGSTGSFLTQALGAGELNYESRRISASGRIFYTENTLSTLYDYQHRHIGFSLIIHDVSEMRRLKEELRRKRREADIFIENSPDIITRYNPQKVCVFVNRIAESLFNTSRSTIIGLSIQEMVQSDPEMEKIDRLLNRVIETGIEAHTRGSFNTPQGKLSLALQAVPEFDAYNRLETVVVIASNITTEIAAQELLLKTLGEAKDLEEFKMRFQKVISHELRTPLAGVKMSADIVERYMESLTPEELLYHTKEINSSVREIETLLDNMLLTMKLETQTLKTNFASSDLIEICRLEVETSRRSHHNTRSIEFSSSAERLTLLLDKYLVHVIVRNIITNAINYSPESSVIHVWVGMLHGLACITIHDTGLGILAEDIPSITEPFFRGKNAENIPGIGMGLFVARHCVELHQGVIDIQSTSGKETTVTVKLPILETK